MKKGLLLTVALLGVLLMAGCAPGPNELAGSSADIAALAGFGHAGHPFSCAAN